MQPKWLPDFPTVEALRQHLAAQSDHWALALEDGKLLAAVNQTLVSFDHPLTDGERSSFLPAGNRMLLMAETKIVVGSAAVQSVGEEYPWWRSVTKTVRSSTFMTG